MRVWILMTLVVMVVLVTINGEEKRLKKKEGCRLNGRFYKEGTIAYKDKSHCLKLRCVKRVNKKGLTKYFLRPKTFKNCRCSVPCPKCSSEWDPVCGTNNKTYVNGCQIWGMTPPCGKEPAEILHHGECGKCPTDCPNDVKPVCGSDDKTYDNECQLLKTACDTNAIVTVEHKVKCEDAPPPNQQDKKCRYNGKKFGLGETIRYLGDNCLVVTCQPQGEDKKPVIVFQELQGSRSCRCAGPLKNMKLL